MKKNIKPEPGHVYYLKDFTAPKVFNGLYFECLLTDQKIRADEQVHEDLGLFTDWPHPIYKPERFVTMKKNPPEKTGLYIPQCF